MAKLKYEFYQHYYDLPGHRHPLRDYLFGYIGEVARVSNRVASLANIFLSAPLLGSVREAVAGLSKQRTLPRLSGKAFHTMVKNYDRAEGEIDCLFLSDAFNEYFYPETSLEALHVLRSTGCKVKVLSTIGAGRTLISKGFLRSAKKHAKKLVDEILQIDPQGIVPIIGLEPSEIYALRDEYPDMLAGDDRVGNVARRAFMIDEFLIRPDGHGEPRISRLLANAKVTNTRTKVLVHGHCYQKAQPPSTDGFATGVGATRHMLEAAGYEVMEIKDGCCGMAGAFGYEAEHYEVSKKVGELALFPAIEGDKDALIAAAGISCQSQIMDGTGRRAYHPISLVARMIADQGRNRGVI